MLKTKTITLAALLLWAGAAAHAQTRGRAAKGAKTQMTAEQKRAREAYERMLPATAQVTFVDSMVVDSADIAVRIPLGRESGRIGAPERLEPSAGVQGGTAYVNELGDRMFYTVVDSAGHRKLYTADKLGGRWTGHRPVAGLGDEFEEVDRPYMMADGVTLYFAGKSKDGLGGWDVYATRYDAASARFYEPENIGLPYNSAADDYYCVIDEFNNLGWLATSRRQPQGKVCIYTFVPTDSRATYDAEALDDDELESLADIRNIGDTQTDKAVVQAALGRLKNLTAERNATKGGGMRFIVNDNTVYTSTADFKSPTNRERFATLQRTKAEADGMAEKLDAMRREYPSADARTQRRTAPVFVKAERQLEKLREYIREAEKEIRNTENMLINNGR